MGGTFWIELNSLSLSLSLSLSVSLSVSLSLSFSFLSSQIQCESLLLRFSHTSHSHTHTHAHVIFRSSLFSFHIISVVQLLCLFLLSCMSVSTRTSLFRIIFSSFSFSSRSILSTVFHACLYLACTIYIIYSFFFLLLLLLYYF